MVRRQASRILVALLAGIPAVACAWNGAGHGLIAAIAYARLSPAARAEADRLLAIGNDPRDFVSAATWADEVRKDRPETANWHYTNIHFRTDRKRTSMKPEAMNVTVAIPMQARILADRTRSDAERGEALRWLIHLIGDVHQPLHAAARDSDQYPTGDRGGNDYKLGEKLNLHSLWDGGCRLLRNVKVSRMPLERDPARTLFSAWGDSLVRNVPAAVRIQDLNPDSWARESFGIAKGFAYSTPEGREPARAYLATGRAHSERRMVAAGVRLAAYVEPLLRR